MRGVREEVGSWKLEWRAFFAGMGWEKMFLGVRDWVSGLFGVGCGNGGGEKWGRDYLWAPGDYRRTPSDYHETPRDYLGASG